MKHHAPVLLLCLAACASQEKHAARPSFDPTACHAGTFSVYFEPWQAALSTEAQATLRAAQTSLAGCKIEHVRIVGLADAVGGKDANQKISQERAETIAAALEAGGWPRAKLEVVARGEKGAIKNGIEKPMRRRASITVEAAAP